MSDPLSIAAGVAGLIALADIIFIKSLQARKLWKTAKHAESEIQALANQVSSLGGTLQRVRMLAQALEDDPHDHSLSPDVITECRHTLETIRKKLKAAEDGVNNSSKMKRLRGKLKWPFSTDEINEHLASLGRHQSSIQLALSADSMDGLLRCLANQEQLRTTTEATARDVKRILQICVRGEIDTYQDRILKFFAKVNPQGYFRRSLDLRYPLTGVWIRRCPEFKEWLGEPGRRLWLSGKAGAGKSVLAGTIIEDALQLSSKDTAVAFFYCDFQDEHTQTSIGILGSLAAQLALQSAEAFEVLEKYYDALHPAGSLGQTVTSDGLLDTLGTMCRVYDRALIVIDGIDECTNLARDVLRTIPRISKLDGVSLAVTSRDEFLIRQTMEQTFDEIPILATNEDVELYVTGEMELRIEDRRLRNISPLMKEEVLESLLKGSGGMFRWVACQLDYLCVVGTDKKRREALENLPPDLDKTYQRILENVPAPQTETVTTTLNFIAYAQEQVSLEQLCEALSASSDGSLLEREDYVPLEEVLFCCSSLVQRSNDGLRLEFAHASVLQYLESHALRDSNMARFHLSRTVGYRTLARKCLEFVHLENFAHKYTEWNLQHKQMQEWREMFPFYEHACFWWTTYASLHMDDNQIQSLARTLFHPSRTGAYTSWVACLFTHIGTWWEDHHDAGVDTLPMLENLCLGADYTTLHVAALLALPEICEFLSTKFKLYASHKVLRLAVTGPQIVTRLLMATGLLTIPGATMDSFFEIDVGTTFDKVQETIRLVFSSGLSITDMSPGEVDEIIASLIERSLFVNPLFLVSAAEFILHTIDYTPQSLSLLPKAQKRFTQMSEAQAWREAWRATRCSAKETSRMEREFRSVTQKLSPLVADYPIVAGLCSAIWGLALHFDLGFTRDPLIVDTCISFSPEALVDALFTATYQDNLYFLEQAVRDPRLTVSELVRDDLSLLEIAVGNGSASTVKLLLGAGCSALPREDCAQTPMHIWAERKRTPSELDRESILCMLLQNGASTSTPNGDGDTAWHIASGFFPSLQALLKVEERSRALEILSVTNDDGDTALSSAFWYGSERCVLVFLSLDGINTAHFRDERPIFELAAELGSHSVTQKLIDMHWDPHLSDDNTLCPLHFLCPQVTPRCLGHLEILYGSTCHSRCGKSLLVGFIGTCLLWMEDEHASPTVPQTRVLKALYRMDKAGMDPGNHGLLWDDVADLLANGLMDLPKSSFHEVSGVVGALIQALHDFGLLEAYESVTGRSCLEPLFDKLNCPSEGSFSGREVSSRKYWSIGYCLGMRTWLRMLRWTNHWPALEHSEAFASFFRMALTRRSNRKGREVVQYMLERGVDLHVRIEGYSALERICLERRVERGLFQQILDGADPARLDDICPRLGEGLLHMISHENDDDTVFMVEELLTRGADPNLRLAKEDRTPAISVFLEEGMQEAACVLLRGNADPTLRCNIGFDASLSAAWQGDVMFLEELASWESNAELRSISWRVASRLSIKVPEPWDPRLEKDLNGLHMGALGGHTGVILFYLERSLIDIESMTAFGGTPLHYATLSEREDIIHVLMDHGANLDSLDSFQELPLHWAVRQGKVGMVKTLLALGTSQTENAGGNTPLQLAVQEGYQDVIECFTTLATESKQHETLGNNGSQDLAAEQILCHAIEQGKLETLRRLLDLGLPVDAEIISRDGLTPLLIAIEEESGEIAQYLLERGAGAGNGGVLETALVRAIEVGGTEVMISALLDRYLQDPKVWWKKPWDFIRGAVITGNTRALVVIIRHIKANAEAYAYALGSDLRASTVLSYVVGWTVLPGSLCWSALHGAANLGRTDSIQVLLENGADINLRTSENETALHIATHSTDPGTLETVECLIENNAFLDARNVAGETAIFWACRNAELGKAALLINSDCALTIKNHAGKSLLHYAAEPSARADGAFRSLFAELVQRGLDPHEPYDGWTPVQMAMMGGGYSSLLLNGDYGIEGVTHFAWGASWHGKAEAWVADPFRLYRRRIPLEHIKSMVSRQSPEQISALYWAASLDCEVAVRNLLDLGVDPDSECGPLGTCLMVACEQGSLGVVKILVRSGAKISYHGVGGTVSAISMSGTFRNIVDWLLVGRHVEQPRLQSGRDAYFSSSDDSSMLLPWSGIGRRVMRGAEWTRRSGESWITFLSRVHQLKRELRGKVVPIGSFVDAEESAVEWRFEKETPHAVHVQMDLKQATEDVQVSAPILIN